MAPPLPPTLRNTRLFVFWFPSFLSKRRRQNKKTSHCDFGGFYWRGLSSLCLRLRRRRCCRRRPRCSGSNRARCKRSAKRDRSNTTTTKTATKTRSRARNCRLVLQRRNGERKVHAGVERDAEHARIDRARNEPLRRNVYDVKTGQMQNDVVPTLSERPNDEQRGNERALR
jgi:hypothetical protein